MPDPAAQSSRPPSPRDVSRPVGVPPPMSCRRIPVQLSHHTHLTHTSHTHITHHTSHTSHTHITHTTHRTHHTLTYTSHTSRTPLPTHPRSEVCVHRVPYGAGGDECDAPQRHRAAGEDCPVQGWCVAITLSPSNASHTFLYKGHTLKVERPKDYLALTQEQEMQLVGTVE